MMEIYVRDTRRWKTVVARSLSGWFWGLMGLIMLAVLTFGSAFTAWAGEWTQAENGDWRYEEEGVYATGWQNIGGIWYYLDTETGIWNPRPAMTGEAASHLLSNKLKEAGLYQDEESEVICRVDYITDGVIYLSVGLQTSPNDFAVITSYEVNQRRGMAENRSTKINFNLWE